MDKEWEQLAWAIHRRSEIQKTLLGLYSHVQSEPEPSTKNAEVILDHLIAAAFSLWRAVFLAHKKRDPTSVRHARQNFLRNLVETNAVAFSDDRTNSAWSVTFYLENAAHRILAARDLLLEFPGGTEFSGFTNYQTPTIPTIEHIQLEWDQTHWVLTRLCTFFFKVTKEPPPAKTSPTP